MPARKNVDRNVQARWSEARARERALRVQREQSQEAQETGRYERQSRPRSLRFRDSEARARILRHLLPGDRIQRTSGEPSGYYNSSAGSDGEAHPRPRQGCYGAEAHQPGERLRNTVVQTDTWPPATPRQGTYKSDSTRDQDALSRPLELGDYVPGARRRKGQFSESRSNRDQQLEPPAEQSRGRRNVRVSTTPTEAVRMRDFRRPFETQAKLSEMMTWEELRPRYGNLRPITSNERPNTATIGTTDPVRPFGTVWPESNIRGAGRAHRYAYPESSVRNWELSQRDTQSQQKIRRESLVNQSKLADSHVRNVSPPLENTSLQPNQTYRNRFPESTARNQTLRQGDTESQSKSRSETLVQQSTFLKSNVWEESLPDISTRPLPNRPTIERSAGGLRTPGPEPHVRIRNPQGVVIGSVPSSSVRANRRTSTLEIRDRQSSEPLSIRRVRYGQRRPRHSPVKTPVKSEPTRTSGQSSDSTIRDESHLWLARQFEYGRRSTSPEETIVRRNPPLPKRQSSDETIEDKTDHLIAPEPPLHLRTRTPEDTITTERTSLEAFMEDEMREPIARNPRIAEGINRRRNKTRIRNARAKEGAQRSKGSDGNDGSRQ